MARKPNPYLKDDDAPELSDAQLAEFRPAAEVLPAAFLEAARRRARGRPPLDVKKVAIKLRLDPDVVEKFRASGPGWQTRMNDALRQAAPPSPTKSAATAPKVNKQP